MRKRKFLPILALIFAGEAIFFLPFVLARVFRPTMLKVFDITNLELGAAFSVYGIVAMLAYFFGGPLADRYKARTLMASALFLTALGGFVMALVPSYRVLIIIYGFYGFTTIFLFWAAMIKATRIWGGEGFQGRAYGILEGGRGLAAALIGLFAITVFAGALGDAINETRTASFQLVIVATSIVVIVAGVLVWFAIPVESESESKTKLPMVRDVLAVARIPAVWLLGVIIISAYVGYKITDDISLYAHEVLSFNEVAAAGVGGGALWLRPVFALVAGFLADRFTGSRVVGVGFLLMIISGLLVYTGWLETTVALTLITLASMLAGVYGIRGIYFALMQDAAIPVVATGTAVGIISMVGYLPDVFMSPLMGWLLDNYPGSQGHRLVFLVLAMFGIVGLVAVRLNAKYKPPA